MSRDGGEVRHELASEAGSIVAANLTTNTHITRVDSVSPVPSEVYIPNRLGNMKLHLDGELRRDRTAVEKIVLYKETKYNSINAFNRFVTFLLCLLAPSVFCMAIGMCSTEWIVTLNHLQYRSMGLIFSCYEGVVGFCMQRGSSRYPRQLRDSLTKAIICEASESFVRAYISAMWSLAIVQFFCILLGIIVTLRIASRPTRSHSSLVVLCLLLLALPCGIVNCVLFHFYTRCERRACEALHSPSPQCRVRYDWGFDVYIASICFNFVACITAIFLCSYPHSIRAQTAQKYDERREQERRRRERVQTSHGERSRHMTRFLRPILGEPEEPLYLTAEELEITIDGANDWVYDDKSDLFYSFDLDMFWDPLTRDYYSRELCSWQATPQGLLELRRAKRSRTDR
ncbi:hypothetical protein C3747_136g89 [Trypanosoma cruzi]|uniref:Uncharacterized protein n=2 Tax=Trypanosoma cruzi TaxID=5693 RepID=Q4DT64_TRYCC|nr:hypothetical protein, conserved [Trypanosoma cruzi]EAN95692.1 hypothetical protein, conserved [Trypanosoma cruzi]PWV05198.1 hypothetical protein C3747_136g89 [Trypanosoma cruzi]RNC55477.1 hypothetical protein TcCL_ESM07033 [Trypanosoma cruzi]|eukprot:XP_817543.1 hypothetical protein [Trypanosoma cruzi strain CL Brener]